MPFPSSSITTKFVALLLGAFTIPSMGCVVDPVEENVSDTFMSFDEFEAQIYRESETGVYIVDDDIPLATREHLKAFYKQYVQQGALTINTNSGTDDQWSDDQKLNLTYCVGTAFGANFGAVVKAMVAATAAWQRVAYVRFVYMSSQDASCNASNNNVVFDVRPTSGQPYLARAFFPSTDRANRYILIDSSAFSTFGPVTLTGILRHELGHTLGFRHEHTRPEAATCFEDDDWRALTPYDSRSVMHYPQCNGANSGDLVLTHLDKEGATKLYGAVYTLSAVDVNGGGKSDLVWNYRGTVNRTYVAMSNGNGTFSRALTAWDQPEQNWSSYTLSAVDVNGDGRTDLVWNSLGTVNRTYVAMSNGNGTFSRVLTAWARAKLKQQRSWDGPRLCSRVLQAA